MSKIAPSISLIIILVIFLSCSKKETTEPESETANYQSISGQWTGQSPHPNNTGWITVDVLINDDNRTLTGSGSIQVIHTSHGVTVEGLIVDNDISITLTSQLNTWNYMGSIINLSKLEGEISGPGFSNVPMELNKTN